MFNIAQLSLKLFSTVDLFEKDPNKLNILHLIDRSLKSLKLIMFSYFHLFPQAMYLLNKIDHLIIDLPSS